MKSAVNCSQLQRFAVVRWLVGWLVDPVNCSALRFPNHRNEMKAKATQTAIENWDVFSMFSPPLCQLLFHSFSACPCDCLWLDDFSSTLEQGVAIKTDDTLWWWWWWWRCLVATMLLFDIKFHFENLKNQCYVQQCVVDVSVCLSCDRFADICCC